MAWGGYLLWAVPRRYGVGVWRPATQAVLAFGLSAVISASVVAFSVGKYAGAAYLLWLAVREIRSPGHFALHRGPVDPATPVFNPPVVVH